MAKTIKRGWSLPIGGQKTGINGAERKRRTRMGNQQNLHVRKLQTSHTNEWNALKEL